MRFLVYFLILFLLFFLVLPIICFFVHIKNKKLELLCRPSRCHLTHNHWLSAWQRTDSMSSSDCRANDRQSNNCAQANETSRDNRYNDIFFIEPNSQEAARIRAQLEKDDKDLPSYDEVMRIASLPTPATVSPTANFIPATPSALTMGASGSSANINDNTLPLPPFREAATHLRPLTPPPYTPEPIGSSVVLPIATPPHSQQNTHSL